MKNKNFNIAIFSYQNVGADDGRQKTETRSHTWAESATGPDTDAETDTDTEADADTDVGLVFRLENVPFD